LFDGVGIDVGDSRQSVGMALALSLDKSSSRVYAILGDGELQEGQIGEATMSAAHYRLDNFCILFDAIGLQIDGDVANVMNVEPIADKFRAFGCNVLEIDGHDIGAIAAALDEAETAKGKPTAIVARTVKGKGVSFFENKASYHGVTPSDEELPRALECLGDSCD